MGTRTSSPVQALCAGPPDEGPVRECFGGNGAKDAAGGVVTAEGVELGDQGRQVVGGRTWGWGAIEAAIVFGDEVRLFSGLRTDGFDVGLDD
jgi:hypothetical protein